MDLPRAGDKKVFRSLIKKYFSKDLLVKLQLITDTRGVNNNIKTQFIIDLLNEYKIDWTPLGNGTNRYGILIDGYAFKIALDRAGQIDNMREMKYSKVHYPDVVKVYECTTNGELAVFEYVTIFSMGDFYENQDEMKEILERLTKEFLVGDVGISTNNYINWGTRNDGSIVILDFAYIYSLSYKAFTCTCEDEGNLQYDEEFNYLICPFCRKKYSFSDIRKRISKQDELNEIGDIRKCGYVLSKDMQEVTIDPSKSPVQKIKEKKHKDLNINKENKNKQMTSNSQMELLEKINKLIDK